MAQTTPLVIGRTAGAPCPDPLAALLGPIVDIDLLASADDQKQVLDAIDRQVSPPAPAERPRDCRPGKR